MTSYGERFEEYLHDAISAGGEVDRISTLAVARLRLDMSVRESVFRQWVGEERFACGRCGTDFSAFDHSVGEDDEIECVWCLKGYRVGAPPVPGWRTAARSR